NGRAIDRHVFKFSAGKHQIIIEPPVYNKDFAYTLGSGGTGRQKDAGGEPTEPPERELRGEGPEGF
ncbi:MAG: hypothetical protein ACOC06_07555, partial [Halorubrum sp.]